MSKFLVHEVQIHQRISNKVEDNAMKLCFDHQSPIICPYHLLFLDRQTKCNIDLRPKKLTFKLILDHMPNLCSRFCFLMISLSPNGRMQSRMKQKLKICRKS